MQDSLTLKPVDYIQGKINIPGSKSISNRVLLLSALSNGKTILKNLLYSDDIKYMLKALLKLGIFYKLDKKKSKCTIYGISDAFSVKNKIKLFLGNAGTAMRPLLAILSLKKNKIILTGEKRMKERPIHHLVDSLRQGGANITYKNKKKFPPLYIKGGFKGGKIFIDGSISSQFLSSLLMAAPLAELDTEIIVKNQLVSKPYINLTINLMEKFGISVSILNDYKHFYIKGNQKYISPKKYYIESDLSSATYFLAAAAIKGGSIQINGIQKKSIQGDINFIKILKQMGVSIQWKKNSVICKKNKLLGITVDCNHIPDAAMTIAILGVFSKKKVYIKNIYNWRVKETDRIYAMSTELKKIGARVITGKDYIKVYPVKNFIHAKINTYNDHRIAMCFSLISLSGTSVTLLNPKCVNKTFPSFFKNFYSICHYSNINKNI
ncbi:3-phosphoshikimate 1-carboxyvinyltransferase [Buchnera aphidicola]|uniref:3-phosphoshikimate 1-carboxyvinyltransferase n=1 Tax=Buchnera aphidicola subsp. Cinara cedri (strain Cc) TaxID=372461 RepID=AROA_BUCCC|nr:3-phosphoshikimate 1-carboxyvinyltransferase [Buchnera aphidicola]Q057N6.1 RecName: Full=3-phosphoshikimate 1-carboxyvinyltransferase; AltName: Full=5-enolpyruvylshikimate-3-phosphate synthase; Short=EPSP synthase; Short=EPSPS [Buchnera aphidicola BCc]ABJ90663.1 3-phosphoshikimate 1-carboxyvinyltransferase [Buchnera aphidicola BCc]